MTFGTLIRRSLRFHWRSHLGVVLGAAIGSAALIGALVVGDSVRISLRENALSRLANVSTALDARDRFFSTDLLERMYVAITNRFRITASSLPETGFQVGEGGTWGAAVLSLPANVSRQDLSARANNVSLFGGDEHLIAILLAGSAPRDKWPILTPGSVWLNANLANQLQARAGDTIVLRVPKPAAFSRDASIAQRDEESISIRKVVAGVFPAGIGNLSLRVGQAVDWNVFMNREELAKLIGVNQQANLLLTVYACRWESGTRWSTFLQRFDYWRRGTDPYFVRDLGRRGDWKSFFAVPASPSQTTAVASDVLSVEWRLADAQYMLAFLGTEDSIAELRTPRVFLEPPVIQAALTADANAQPMLTYLATLLRAGTNATPYSMVTAVGAPLTPTDLRDDEIVVSQWLAEDLRVKPGDEIVMSYFLPESGAKLEEATNTFRVRAIVPMEMPWADRTLMPDFPGIEKAESTSEWDAGFPLTYKVRPKDDEYWKLYRGTPKAFITLATGQKMWGNRFGNLTAIRFTIPTNRAPENYHTSLEKKILANLKPEELGLRFEPVREQALQAAENSQDFGGLFLGFSFFLIIAALLLMALLFQLGLEQRAPEIGTLLALGFTPKQVRKLLLREGLALAFLGGIIGTLGGLAYARAMLHGLTTIWRDAVGASALSFHFTGQTLVIGLFASVVVSAVTIRLSLGKYVKRPARDLLVGEIGGEESKVQNLKSKVVATGALLAAFGLVGFAVANGDTSNAGIFFGAGALVLVAGLSFAGAGLAHLGGAPNSRSAARSATDQRADLEIGAAITLGSLAVRGCARRRKRSLSTIAMLACGSFLIVSIGVFRLDANRDATKRTSGTGGFALIGETTMPVVQDLNSLSGREFFALNERDLAGVSFVPFRVREGDEASCLNLNAAQRPRLLGVKPEILEGRFAFTKGEGWASLRGYARESVAEIKPERNQPRSDERSHEIAAIGDANSIQWAMHKKVGDTIDYVDERGQPFKVRIVGAVANSILQGQLIIDEAEFVKRFPGESGYRTFLIDAPSNAVSQVSASLSRAMQDVGLELTPAAQRLDQFNAVQNTYLGTFQVLGGLGLLLGSLGLGIVVLRNVLERRGELALLVAVGFRKSQVQQLLLRENAALLVAGLALGVAAAVVAVFPALASPGAQFPVASLTLTLGAVLINGAAWTWVATRLALRGDLLAALRNE